MTFFVGFNAIFIPGMFFQPNILEVRVTVGKSIAFLSRGDTAAKLEPSVQPIENAGSDTGTQIMGNCMSPGHSSLSRLNRVVTDCRYNRQ